MAGGDYLSCVNCDAKTVYDADINYEEAVEYRLHDIVALCKDCGKTHSLQLVDKPSSKRLGDVVDNILKQKAYMELLRIKRLEEYGEK